MNKINIRKARLEDLNILLEFEQGIITAERPFDPTLKEEKINYYDIEKMITAPHIEVLIAEIDSEIVGSGYARIETAKPYLNHDNYAYLGFMYTDPKHRGKGINANIIDALKKWCLSQNITELRLDVYNDNPSAIRAYEKVGFKKHLVNMRVEL
ncbi:Acetyltransferase (GNAT) family protein [Flavobacterium gillisiae]|uniref:Acetyltransferase (GNAT) family protein n=1 Tax=Flavobacterium gillisiae TaxID=150146 RepID=A0A1H4EXH5_9FLAO|nr:GNAT family N-acetyltransferase [Flavobacterium gillisiae]SEA89774.1 Acetyltransferase (GNAT) family protein [Flavobacterium gillisiae]